MQSLGRTQNWLHGSKSGDKTAKFIFSTTRTLSIHSGTRFKNVEKINNYTKLDVWPGGREWCCRVAWEGWGEGRGGGVKLEDCDSRLNLLGYKRNTAVIIII